MTDKGTFFFITRKESQKFNHYFKIDRPKSSIWEVLMCFYFELEKK